MRVIEVLGTGCPKCKKLTENAEAAASEMGLEFRLEKVTDVTAIIQRGVMMTPALAIDGEIKATGQVLTKEQIRALLS